MPKPDPIRRESSDFVPSSWENGPSGLAADQVDRELLSREVSQVSGEQALARSRRDYRTGALTAAVIALSILLGWLVGRAGWNMAVNRAQAQGTNVAEEVLAAAPVTPHPLPVSQASTVAAAATGTSAVSTPPFKPAPKPKTEAVQSEGGLVMYEHGKVVFRAAPSGTSLGVGVKNNGSTAPSDQSARRATDYLLTRVVPRYPEEAREQGVQGPVVMNALVGADGSVQEVRVVSGDPKLVQAASEAVRQWRFRPHLLKGNPVEFETQVTVNFSLP